MDIVSQFQKELQKINAKVKFISITHLRELEDEVNAIKENRIFGKKVYDKYLNNYYDFASVYTNTDIKSLCIVASPSHQNLIRFEFESSQINVNVPPIYLDRKEILNNIKNISNCVLGKLGWKTFPVTLPKKSMAVHSGMARYGKNNLTYIDGMGSYHRLTAFASDIPYDTDEWYELRQLDNCHSCGACEKHCPTRAINKENFLIDTDKCITFYNEQPENFPDWIDLSWHNSLVGCIKCQEICPQNKFVKQHKEIKAVFNKDETRMIMNQLSFYELSESLQEKLVSLSLDIYYDKLSRNLAVLLTNALR